MFSPLLEMTAGESAASYGWRELALAASFLIGVIAVFFLLQTVDKKLRSRSSRQK